MFSIILSSFAEIDLQETNEYYSQISENLNDLFWEQLDVTVFRIKQNPQQFQLRYKNVRIAFFETLPFGIHFEIDENLIKIIRILHTKRNF